MNVCVLLAAGSSSRMGSPKMLLEYKGESLLQHCINAAGQLPGNQSIVVTGCYHEILQPLLIKQRVDKVFNSQWQLGMGSSIKTGIQYLQQTYPTAASCILLVCDQPFITTALLNQLIAQHSQTGKRIIACAYDNAIGTPVLFDKKYFPQLAVLEGTHGAKKVIQQFIDDMSTIDFPEGAIDIDTPDDYQRLQS